MAHTVLDNYNKAVLDAGISGKDWRKTEAFDSFTRYFDSSHTPEQRQSMKYDAVLIIAKEWWKEHHSKYS